MKLKDDKMRADYYEAIAKYGLDGAIPDDPVIEALITWAMYSIDKNSAVKNHKVEYMQWNSNAVKNWEKVSKQTQTDSNRLKQRKTDSNREKQTPSIKNRDEVLPSEIEQNDADEDLREKEAKREYKYNNNIYNNNIYNNKNKKNKKIKTKKEKKEKEKIEFEEFWKIYPNKQDKKKAKEKFERLPLEKQQQAIDWVKRLLNSKKRKDWYIPLPTTYINGERREDEIILDPAELEKQRSLERYRARVRADIEKSNALHATNHNHDTSSQSPPFNRRAEVLSS